MRYLTVFVLTFLPVIIFCQQLNNADSLSINSIITDWDKAWRNKDYQLASKGYGDKATFINAFGDRKIGPAEIMSLLKEVFSLPFVMSGQSEAVEHSFVVLSGDNVIVNTSVVRKGQKMPDGTVMADRQTSHLRVFAKHNGSWEIVGHLISDARDKQLPKH